MCLFFIFKYLLLCKPVRDPNIDPVSIFQHRSRREEKSIGNVVNGLYGFYIYVINHLFNARYIRHFRCTISGNKKLYIIYIRSVLLLLQCIIINFYTRNKFKKYIFRTDSEHISLKYEINCPIRFYKYSCNTNYA